MLMKIIFTRAGKTKRRRQAAAANRGTKALAGSISGLCRVLAISAITALGLGEARAVSYFWDPGLTGGPGGGGTGTWDAGTTVSWWPGTGNLDVIWDNSGTRDAVFGNSGGIVDVADAVKVGSLTISAASYQFSGNGSLELSGGTRTINVVNSGQKATITTFLKGTGGFTKAGAGILILDSDSSGAGGIIGGITLSGGTLTLDHTASATILNQSNTLTFSNTAEFQFKAASPGPLGTSMALSTVTFSGGEGTVHSIAGTALDNAVLTFSNLAARAAGATGNFKQDALPKIYGATAPGVSSTITLSVNDAIALNMLPANQSVTGANIAPGTTVQSVNTTTGVVTLSGPTSGAVSGNVTFGLATKRIILTNINGAAATTGFINQGVFFNGDSYAYYDTANLSRVRAIKYDGVDQNTALPQGASNTGILAGSANKHVQVTGDIAGQGNLTLLTLNLSGSSFVNGIIQNPGTTLTLTNAGILKSGVSTATISGGTIQAGSTGTAELVIRADGSSDRLFINSVLTATGVTKSGLGSLLLNPQTAGALSFSGSATTLNSATLQLAPTNQANPAVLMAGQAVNGPGIPAGTTIVSVSGSTVTLSANANATSPAALSYSTALDSTSANITLAPAEAGTLTVGQVVTGAGIAPNTVIAVGGINTITGVVTLSTPPTSSVPLQTVTFGGATVAFGSTQNFNVTAGPLTNDHAMTTINSTTVNLIAGIPSLLAGMSVEGPGISPGTTIASVSGTTVTLSQVATSSSATAFGNVTIFLAQVGGGSNTTTLQTSQSNQLVIGTLVTGVNIPTNTTVTAITPAGGGNNTVTFSNPTPAPATFPTTVGGGSTTLTLTQAQVLNVFVGTSVTGTNIASGTFVQAINSTTGVVTLSQATTGVAGTQNVNFAFPSNQNLTFGGQTVNFGARTITLTPAQAASVLVGSTVSGPGIPATTNTTVISIQDLGSYKIATLSNATTGTVRSEFLSFGGATVVGINSAYSGNTLVNSGVFAVSASGIPSTGAVTIAAGAEFAAVNSIIANNITITGANATLSAAGGNNGGFSGAINVGANDFQLKAQDFSTSLAANLNISGAITGSGRLIVPNTSNGIVTLSGNNIAFTGPLTIENGGTLSIARLNSLPGANPILLGGTLKLALDGNGGAAYASGGNGTGAPQTLAIPSDITLNGGGTIQPDRDGTAYSGYFTRAANKTVQLNRLTLAVETLSVQNNSGFGVRFTGIATMNGASNFNVVTATASNAVPGLTLTGQVIGGAIVAAQDTLLKTGSGTLVLANNLPLAGGGNTFGGNGSIIHIRGGALAFGSNAALGDPLNAVSLDWETNGNSGAVATLRGIGTFSTARVISLNSASNIIEVTGGNTLTLNRAFELPVGSEGNPLIKGENGTLVIQANNNTPAQTYSATVGTSSLTITLSIAQALTLPLNRAVTGTNIDPNTTAVAVDTTTGVVTLNQPTGSGASATQSVTFAGETWAGPVTINAGAIRVQNGNALGNQATGSASRLTVARTGAALQIGGGGTGATVNNPLTLSGSGLSSAGALQSLTGPANFATNQIVLSGNTTIGADSGSTLNLTGGITGASGVTLTLNSAGTINITGSALDPAYAFSGDLGTSTTITNVTNIATLVVGLGITGPNIPGGTTITAINTVLNQITISRAATATVTQALTAQGNLNVVKFGGGTATLGVDSPTFVGFITVNQGTLAISGSGVTIGNPAGGTNNSIFVQGPSGIFVLDDSVGAAVGDRIPGNRNFGMAGGTFIYNGNAAGSSENLGTLTTNRGVTNVVQSNPNGAAGVALNFSSVTINLDSNVDFQGTGLGVNGTNKITFSATPGNTNGLIQRATINGVDFASYNTTGAVGNTNGIQAFTAYNSSNNINTSAATDTLNLTADPASLFNGSKTINAFKISGNITASDSGLQGNTLTLSAGAILSTTGNNTVNFKVIAFGGTQAFLPVSTGSQLTVGSLLTGSGGFVKALPGTLLLNAPDDRAGYANLSGQTLTGNFEVNAGKVVLGGGNNTLTPNNFLIVATGATLDLNGTSQFAFGTRGDGAALQGNAGIYTNSNASPAALIFGADNGGVNFGGVIQQDAAKGAMSFFKASGQTYNFSNANTYSGATVFAGGSNVLLDGGSLSATSSIALNYARLAFNDDATFASSVAMSGITTAGSASVTVGSTSGLSLGMTVTGPGIPAGETIVGIAGNTVTLSSSTGVAAGNNSLTFAFNRVNTAATITLRGGSLAYTNGRTQTETTQTVGPVVLSEGQNLIQAVNGGTGVNSAVLTLASLTRPGGASSTVRFPDNGTLGLIGNSGRIVITAPPTLSQNLIGGWAVVDREFASYIPVLGVGALSQTGFAGYSTNSLNRQPLATDNIRATLNVPGLAVDTTVNTLAVNTNVPAVGGVPVATIIDLGGKKLTLAGGGLILALNGDNQNITVQNGTITSGVLNAGGDLYVHALNYGGNNRTFTINAGITDNGSGAVRLIKASGSGDNAPGSGNADFLTLNGTNTYTGGTVVNGGNLVVGATGNIPAGGITISGGDISGVGAIFQDVGGVIHPANTVTVNGLGALSLVGSNTLAGLVFNDSGGGGTSPVVTTFRSLSPIGTGTLTLGGGGIASTPLNPASVATVAGRLDFGAASSTVTVNTYNFSTFTDFAPTTAGLVLQGVIGSGGGITKQGGGVLQFNAQDVFTGQLNVAAGTVQIGSFNAGSRFSQLNLSTATSRLNLNNQSTVLGSLAGNGIITSTAGTPTLTVGFDNSNSTFSGQISRFNDATPNAVTLIKVGTGTLTMTSAQSGLSGSSGGVTVNGGGLTYSGVGASYPSTQLTPVTYNVNTSGTITLDNFATNVPNRLGLGASQGTLNLSGGTLAIIANAVGSSETVNVLNFGNGASTIQFTPGAGGATTLNVTGSFSNQGGQDSGLVTGSGLGGSGAGSVNVVVTGTFSAVGGGGGAGTETISIRPDLLGDATGGPGTGFLTRDTGTNNLRPLNQGSELTSDMAQAALNLSNNSNVGLTSPTNATANRIIASQTINSLTLLGAGTPSLTSGLGLPAGVFAPSALPLTVSVSSGGFLALTNATIGVGAITSGGTTGDYHVVGASTTLTLNTSIVSSTNGIVKADAGTLIFNARQYYTGSTGNNGTTVNGGTLRLNGGNNTIVVQPTGTIPTPLSLFLNGGTLDLFGNSQIVERILNNNVNAGTGGVIINSGGSIVTLTSATGAGTTFAGSIGTGVLTATNNAINFVKSGNSTLVLTNTNTYTGTTVLRGGILQLQDLGTLATSGITVNFGTLLLNEAGLNPAGVNPVRVPVAAAITLNGGTLQQNSGGSLDASATFGTVNLGTGATPGGASVITQSTVQGAGSSAMISIGSLVQSATATVNFASGNGTLGGGGLNNNQIQIANITPSVGAAGTPASLLVNGMLPGWITVNGSDFASYLSSPSLGSLGIGALGSANFPAYAAPFVPAPFTFTAVPAVQIFAIANSSFNLSITATVLPVAGRVVNSVAIRAPGGATVVPLNLPTDTVSIGTGGLLINSAQTVNIQGGRVTAGSAANAAGVLYVTASSSGALAINSQIVDNVQQTYSGNTDGISNVITVGSTSGLVVGQAVSGPGIPAGATIQSLNPNGTSFTINSNTTAASFKVADIPKTNSSLTSGSNAVTVANTTNLVVGEYVSGPGIPAGTTVTALGTTTVPNTITLSNGATRTISQQSFFAPVGNNATNINLTVPQAATLTVGMAITGTNIPLNTTVTAINTGTGQITVSNPTTGSVATQLLNFGATLNFARLGTYVAMPANTPNSGANSVLGIVTVNNLTGLVAGMTVSGPGIPAGSIITAFGTAANTVPNPNNTAVFIQPPTAQFLTMTGNTGINLVFGTGIAIGDATVGPVSLVKTGTGTLTLIPQLVMNASFNGGNIITVPTTAGLVAGMTVNGPGIPGEFITAINGNTVFISTGTGVTAGTNNLTFGSAVIVAGTTTVGSNTVTVANANGLAVGMIVTGASIPTGPTISAITGPNTYTLSTNVTPTQGSQLTYSPGTSGINLTTSAFSNNYTGGTFVNQGTLNLGGLAGTTVIPGNLTINGSTGGTSVNMLTNPQQIAATGNVTINGTGTLNLVGANTLASLSFNNTGGNAAPTVALGTSGTLTLTNGLIVINDSLSFTPTISGTTSTLALPNNTITTSGASPDSLLISVPLLPTGALVKNGTGSLILGGTSTFTTGVNLNAGSIILPASSTPASGTVTSGPLGTGTLTMANGTALLSDGTLRTIANAVTIAADATFGPLAGSGTALAGNGVILAGPVTLTSGIAHTLTVPDLQNVTTISGTLSGGTSLILTKAGTGMLVLSNSANTYTGTPTINVTGGVLRLGAATAVPAGLQLSVSQGAVYDINGNANQFLSTLTNPTPNTPNAGGLVTNSGGAQTLFIGGTSAADVTTNVNAIFDGMLTAATTGNLALTKVGLGRQTLTGTSNYTGATTVFAGGLIVNGVLGATNVTVNGGAILGGTGSIGVSTVVSGSIFQTAGGSVVVGGGATPAARGTIDLTTNNAIGTFTLNTLGSGNALTIGTAAANTPSLLNFDIANNNTDRIDITGSARLLVNLGGGIVNLTQLPSTTLAAGNYNLITYAGATYTGNFTGGTVTGSVSGSTFALNGYVLNQTPSSLILSVGGALLDFFWRGDVNNVWNTNVAGNTNWATLLDGITETAQLPNPTAIVTFKSTPATAASLNTTLGTDFTIDQLIFNSTVATPVTIGAPGTLTLNNNLQIASALGGTVTISTTGLILGGTQAWTNSTANNLTVTAPVSGSSPLTITSTSTGRVILNGNNSGFTGGITVNGNGTVTALQLGSGTALGPVAGPNPLVVNVGALDLFGQNATVSSLSSTVATGVIRNTNASTTSVLTVNQSGTTTYSGTIQDVLPAKVALIVDGGGTLQLITTANTYSAGTIINNATVRMGNNGNEIASSLGTGLVTINSGGALNFAPGTASTTTFNILNSFSLNGGQIQSSGGNQHLLASGGNISVTATGGTITPTVTLGQDLFVDGVLAGSGPLTVGGTGSGKVILTNNTNSYSGTLTSTSAGNLQLAGTTANSTALASADLVNIGTTTNGLSFNGIVAVGTPITSATFGSLSGSGNFALQNTATTPAAVALTVGGNNNALPLTYGGVISNSAAGINGTLTKTGSGTLILSGLNTYRGTTTVNGSGALRVNNNNTTVSVTGLGNVLVNGTATLGGNGVIQGGDNITAGVVTLASGTFLDPGLTGTPASFGTLRFGVQTGAAVNTTLTLSSGSTYKFDLGAGAGSQDRVSVVGPATISGANLTINSVTAPDQGKYTVLSVTTALTGVFATTGIPAGYSLVYTASTVDLQRFATIGSISTPAGLQVIKGGSVAFGVTVQNSAPTGSADLSFTANSTPGTNTTGVVSPAVVVGAQTSGTGNGLSFNSAAVPIGPAAVPNGSFTVTATGASNSPQTGNVSVDVLDHAVFAPFTGGTLTLPNVRQGYIGPVTSANSLTVTNAAGFRVNLAGSVLNPPVSNLSINALNGVAQNTSGSITASLASGLPASATPYSQAFTYTFVDDSTLNGAFNSSNPTPANRQLGTVNITATVNVYNGQGVWGSNGSGSWGTFNNWTLPGGYPGLDGAASINDTATFGSTLTGTASLDGVAPLLNALSFNNSSGIVAQGVGSGFLTLQNNQNLVAPTINVTGGTPTVSAPITFSNTVTATITGVNDRLTVSGSISDAGGPVASAAGLTKAGSGTLVLSGVNGYRGKTIVNGGTLTATNSASFGAAPGSLVADQITINNNAKLAFTGDATLSVNQGITVSATNGTLDVAANQTAVVNGALSGSGTLTKTGSGTLDLRSSIQGPFILSAGIFAPTVGAPAFLITGDLDFKGGTLAIDVLGTNGAGNPGGHDFLTTSGPVKITAPTNLTINLGSFHPTPTQDAFTLITDGSGFSPTTSFFFVVNGVTASPGTTFSVGTDSFKIDYAGGGGGNDIVLISVVPEPGSAVMLLGGIGLLTLMQRRRRRGIPFGV